MTLPPLPKVSRCWNPCVDPRRDLKEDTALWSRLLPAAFIEDGDGPPPASLFWAIQGLRCCGARLTIDGDTARLGAGEMAAEDYAAQREKYLRPHGKQLVRLLRDLAAHPCTAREQAEKVKAK